MPRSRMKYGLLAAAGLIACATSASAYDGASISVTGHVPTICRVTLASASSHAIQTGSNDLGVMEELCNNLGGYTVTLNHPAGLVDAWVDVGGKRVPISPNETHTVIVDAHMPAYRERPVRLMLGHAPEATLNLSLEAEPRGEIF